MEDMQETRYRLTYYSHGKHVHCVTCSIQLGMADLDRDGVQKIKGIDRAHPMVGVYRVRA